VAIGETITVEKSLLRAEDILGWDAANWSACLRFWEPHLSGGHGDCLELGCGPGGISLWLALKGHRVVCSDLIAPSQAIRDWHRRCGAADCIRYETVDATNISCEAQFDIVVIKSVLGGIWAYKGLRGLRQSLRQIHTALKPGGKLLFAENLRATPLHMFCRSYFLARDSAWKYPTATMILRLLRDFSAVEYRLSGFLGTFGRSERQRAMLSYVDRVIVPVLPQRWRYIMSGVAVKEPA
jgi:SAM-dependent methyltransferase